MPALKKAPRKKINLALQGGGAHGAYSWGVLDRILEDPRLEIDGVSGTSAGAMNAVVLASGFAKGGSEGARNALAKFWEEVSEVSSLSNPIRQIPFESYLSSWNLDWTLSYNWFDWLTRSFSPYQLNPMNINPLRGVLERTLDIDAIHACKQIQTFITATHVESGQPHVFQGKEVTIDAVLASACIPFMFQAVEIDGEPYWDGGYMGNPALWPLIYHTTTEDILLVQVNPLNRPGVPKQPFEIINRLNEITFNSSLISEMRAIHFVKKLIKQHKLDRDRYKNIHMHVVAEQQLAESLDASSKMNTHWDFFVFLKGKGYEAADAWLKQHRKDIGERSTIDIEAKFLRKQKNSMD